MIFLSASIPSLEDKDPKYFETADVIAIRDSVRALANLIIPKTKLVWGGHPAITPLIHYVMSTLQIHPQEHVLLYQSAFFQKIFPTENSFFEDKVITEDKGNVKDSLAWMRERMFKENKFLAGVFIGGMNGVEDEYELFIQAHPQAHVFPIASTGAAAKIIYDNSYNRRDDPESRLASDYAYLSLFRKLFQNIIKLD
jgi:SLOG cluster3 family